MITQAALLLRTASRAFARLAFAFMALATGASASAWAVLESADGHPMPVAVLSVATAKAIEPDTRQPHPETPVVKNPVRLKAIRVTRHRKRLAKTVSRMARRYKLDPRLVLAIIQIESGYNRRAKSPAEAVGLMQLTPATAARFGVKNRTSTVQNLRGGMAYLRWLLGYFRGDVTLVAAAYNAGEGNVNKYRGVPPFAETMRYVQKFRAIYHRDWHPYNARIKPSRRVAGIERPLPQAPVAMGQSTNLQADQTR